MLHHDIENGFLQLITVSWYIAPLENYGYNGVYHGKIHNWEFFFRCIVDYLDMNVMVNDDTFRWEN